MEDLIKEIQDQMAALSEELKDCMANKSAAKRARVMTSSLTKLFKDFRAESVAHDKKK